MIVCNYSTSSGGSHHLRVVVLSLNIQSRDFRLDIVSNCLTAPFLVSSRFLEGLLEWLVTGLDNIWVTGGVGNQKHCPS